jgi:hypothetical protein
MDITFIKEITDIIDGTDFKSMKKLADIPDITDITTIKSLGSFRDTTDINQISITIFKESQESFGNHADRCLERG